MNREDGFIGTSLRKDEFVCDCSDLDEIIAFRADGKFTVSKVAEKTFVGKDIIHAQVFTKNDERTVYNLIYKDGGSGTSYVKRFAVLSVTRDKEYDLTKGGKGSQVHYFTANPNGEAEVVTIALKPHAKLRKLQFDVDFAEIAVKGRSSMGNTVTKYPVKKITLKTKGVSTLSGRKIWFDEVLKRLNIDARGKYLGEYDGDDQILCVTNDGAYELCGFELSTRFDEPLVLIEKYNPEKVYSVVHWEAKSKNYYIKRFVLERTPEGKKTPLISEETGSKLVLISDATAPKVSLEVLKGKSQTPETIELNLAELIDVKGQKAMGNRLSTHEVKQVTLLFSEEPEPILELSPMNEVLDMEDNAELVEGTKTPSMPEPEPEEVKEIPAPQPETALETPEEAALEPIKPVKEIDFEITNPDEIDMDDKGQLGLF